MKTPGASLCLHLPVLCFKRAVIEAPLLWPSVAASSWNVNERAHFLAEACYTEVRATGQK